MTYKLTGLEPYQIPSNADLGTMAYQNAEALQIGLVNVSNTLTISGLVAPLTVGYTQAAAGTLLYLNQVPSNINIGGVVSGTNIPANTTVASFLAGFQTSQPTYTGTTATTVIAMTSTYGVAASMAVGGTGITYGTLVSSISGTGVPVSYLATSSTVATNTIWVGTTTGISVNSMAIGAGVSTGTLVTAIVANTYVTVNQPATNTVGQPVTFAPTVTLSSAIVANTLTQNLLFYPTVTLSQATSAVVPQGYVVNSYYASSNASNASLVVGAGGLGVTGNSYFANGVTAGGTVTATTLIATGAASVGTNLTVSGASGYVYTANIQETQNNGLQIYVPYNSIVPTVSFYGGTGAKLVVNTSGLSLAPSIAGGYQLGTAALPFGTAFVNSATISGNFPSTSTSTGALQVVGGVGVGGNLNVGGSASVIATGATTNANAQVVINNNTVYNQVPVNTGTNLYIFGGSNQNGVGAPNILIESVGNGAPYNPQIQMVSQQDGGAFGPLGVINFMGNVVGKNQSASAIIGYSPTSGGTTVPGGLRFYTNNGATTTTTFPITSLSLQLDQNGNATFYSTSATVSTNTGALQVIGGVGIGGGLYVGGTTSTISGNLYVGPVPATSYYSVAPLNMTNSLTGNVKTQLNLINTGGSPGAGSAIDFYTYTDQTTSTAPGARVSTVDDGSFSASWNFYTKNPGAAANTLVLRLAISSTGTVTISSTASSVSTNTGALQVIGGVGIGGGLVVGGTVTATTFVGTFAGSVAGVSNTATNIQNGSAGAIPYQSAPGVTTFAAISTAGYVLQSSGAIPQWVNIGPTVLNDISGQFDGSKTVFNLLLDQTVINSIVDSKDLEVVIGGQRLAPYVDILPYPWLTPYDSFKGFKVASNGQLIIYNAPYRGDTAMLTLRQQTTTRQKRKYPYSATTIAFGD